MLSTAVAPSVVKPNLVGSRRQLLTLGLAKVSGDNRAENFQALKRSSHLSSFPKVRGFSREARDAARTSPAAGDGYYHLIG